MDILSRVLTDVEMFAILIIGATLNPFQLENSLKKYSTTSTPYHTCYKIWTSTIYYPMMCLKIVRWVANRVDSDEMPLSEASHLVLHCFLMLVCPNTYGRLANSVDPDQMPQNVAFEQSTQFALNAWISINYKNWPDTLLLETGWSKELW